MAKFILGNKARKVAQQRSWLSKVLWFFDLLLIGGLVKLLALLPVEKASATGRWIGCRIGPLMRQKSSKIRQNLSIAFPDKSPDQINRLISDIWGSSGAVLAEYAHLDYLSDAKSGRIRKEVLEPIESYTNTEKPAVFVTAHLCNWELVASAIAQFGIKFVSLYSPPHNPWLDRMLKNSRMALGCELLPRDVSMRPLIRAMVESRSVAMVVDRRVDEGELVPFFGCAKLTSVLPARLALKFNCPLIPVKVKRMGGANFKVVFYPPIVPLCIYGTEMEQAIDMMTQLNNLFEQWIRDDPQEWFCSKRLWSKSNSKRHTELN